MRGPSHRVMAPILERVAADEAARAAAWRDERLGLLPARWAAHVGAEHARRGGLGSPTACRWLLGVTELAEGGRLPLSASDDAVRAAAARAAGEVRAALAGVVAGGAHRHADGASRPLRSAEGVGAALALARAVCARWGVAPPEVASADAVGPALARLSCARWWLRRLRRAHARRCEGAAIGGGVVRRGLWPYASQDTVERRAAQRRRNALATAAAQVACVETGEALPLADVVAGSVANPEVKRSELMVRIRGMDDYAEASAWGCEFWTMTTPSRFHAQRIVGAVAEPNPEFGGATPREAQAWLCQVWARWRAWVKRRGLVVAGLRTAEPHHDGTPHWHLVVYGPRRDLRHARRVLRVYLLRDGGDEPGARRHRFAYLVARGGQAGARYAAKYISKNINGAGLEGERDGESGRRVSATVTRVDAWAAAWGIRQFQFFGGPAVGFWRALRRMREPVAVPGSELEQARAAADRSDWCAFWQACAAGGLRLIKRAADRLTQYGDAAADVVAGVAQGARRALLPTKTWVIHWGGKAAAAGPGWAAGRDRLATLAAVFGVGVGVGVPRSGVNNCTRPPPGGGGGGLVLPWAAGGDRAAAIDWA